MATNVKDLSDRLRAEVDRANADELVKFLYQLWAMKDEFKSPELYKVIRRRAVVRLEMLTSGD